MGSLRIASIYEIESKLIPEDKDLSYLAKEYWKYPKDKFETFGSFLVYMFGDYALDVWI